MTMGEFKKLQFLVVSLKCSCFLILGNESYLNLHPNVCAAALAEVVASAQFQQSRPFSLRDE